MQSITKTWLLYTWNDNKRHMGYIAHLRKQFKSINTYYDYIITLINRIKIPSFTLWEFNCSSFEQTWIPFTQGCFVPNLVEIAPVVLEKKSKIEQVYGRTDRQRMDDRRSEKLTWAFSSGELKRRCFSEISKIECFLLTDTYLTFADGTCTHKIPHFNFFTKSF